MRFRSLIALAAVALVATASFAFAAAKKPADCACPISGQPAKADKSAEFDGGTVYFCCGNCQAAFKKDSSKHAAKAHLQMVATGELVQTGCPFSGRDVNASTVIAIGDAEVGFCCNNCKGKAEKAEGDDQVALVFGDISKGFKTPAELEKAK
jgi:YHS domain-containing protein